MALWYNRHPPMVGADLIHPSPQGARIVAQLLTGQLLIGYERYMQNHPAPQPKLPPPVISETSTQPDKTPSPWGCNKCCSDALATCAPPPRRLRRPDVLRNRDRRNNKEAPRAKALTRPDGTIKRAPAAKPFKTKKRHKSKTPSKSASTKSVSTKSSLDSQVRPTAHTHASLPSHRHAHLPRQPRSHHRPRHALARQHQARHRKPSRPPTLLRPAPPA